MAHVPGVENVVADALSSQHDDDSEEDRAAVVHVVTHLLADVDLEDLWYSSGAA